MQQYLGELRREPLLTAAEEIELSKAIEAGRTPHASPEVCATAAAARMKSLLPGRHRNRWFQPLSLVYVNVNVN